MKKGAVSAASILLLLIYGLVAFFMAWNGSSRFLLAFFPLLIILVGVAFVRQSGLTMAFVGLVSTIFLAVFQFDTPIEVALGSTAYGFVNSFGISISVSATMLLIFLMKEAGALETVSKVIKQQIVGDEMRALYIGVGFGSFLSSLGVVTPALFPPLLVAMGFSPMSSVAIAVLGYDPTTSFSLLSIPITLPAEASKKLIDIVITPVAMAFKIAIFLPLVSTGFAFAILWLVGGRASMRRGAVPATICGLTLAFACLGTVSLDYFTGVEYVPLRIVGVVAGLCAMLALHAYQKARLTTLKKEKPLDYPSSRTILRSFSPWIILTALAAVVSVPQVGTWLQNLPGNMEKIVIFADQTIDLNILSQIYTWILIAVLLSLFTLRLTIKQAMKATSIWLKRFIGPFLAYSLCFCIAYVMANSAKTIANGILGPSQSYNALNMNVVLGSTLAAIFGAGYIFVAASLGLFGAVVGGSETSSNVLFLKVQRTAAQDIQLTDPQFMTVYGSHAVAGGIASAITPAKINNAVVTIDESHDTESTIMRRHLVIAILLTIATGILTGVFIKLGI